MSKKDSFVCYAEWLQYFDMLKTDAERAEIARAMFLYNIDGTVPDKSTHSTSFMVLFAMMKNQFDRDNEKYQNKVEKNRENAKKSHQANATNRKQTLPNATEHYRTLPMAADNGNGNDADNGNGNDDDNEITTTQHARPTSLEVAEYFGQFLDEEKAGIQAWRWYQYNEQRGWDCLPDWKSAAHRWIEKI